MRLIEKSLTENIYNALNESFDSDKATKRLARYKKSEDVDLNNEDLTTGFVNVDIGEGNDSIHFMYNKDTQEVIYTKGYAAGRVHKKTTYSKLPHEEFPYTTEGIIKAYIDTKLNTINESEEAQLNGLYNASKVEWDDLSGSDQTAVEYFSSNFGDNIADKSWDEVESDIREACHEIGYANEELINSGYWNDGDMDPEPDEKKVTDYIFQNYFLPKKNSKNMNESTETGKITLKDYAMKFYEGDIDIDVTDTEIGMMVAFVYDFNEEPKDNYDRFLNILGERTEVVKVGNNVLTCDFSSVFKPYEDKLQDFFDMDFSEFNEAYYEAVSNLEPLISGNAGEKTYKELADILSGKQINESASYEGYTDKEIIEDVIDNFKEITGKEIKDVLNYDEAVEGFFKQGEVESTGESIINYLTKKGLSRSHIDELLYKLDDELTSLWNKL